MCAFANSKASQLPIKTNTMASRRGAKRGREDDPAELEGAHEEPAIEVLDASDVDLTVTECRRKARFSYLKAAFVRHQYVMGKLPVELASEASAVVDFLHADGHVAYACTSYNGRAFGALRARNASSQSIQRELCGFVSRDNSWHLGVKDAETTVHNWFAKLWGMEADLDKLRAHVVMLDEYAFVRDAIVGAERAAHKLGASVLAIVCQDFLRQVLLVINAALKAHGREGLDCFIFDGGHVPRLNNESELPPEIIEYCEACVESVLGIDLTLEVRPFSTGALELPALWKDVIDDSFAAHLLVKLEPADTFHRDNDTTWVFNSATGTYFEWTEKAQEARDLLERHRNELQLRAYTFEGPGKLVLSYGGSMMLQNALIKALPGVLPREDGWLQSMVDSDCFKVLFTDGIYDFKASTFTPGFDRGVVFTSRVPISWPSNGADEADIATLNKILFEDPFLEDSGVGGMMRHMIMRAVIGDYQSKLALVGTGPTNSGKGVLSSVLQAFLGKAATTFSMSHLLIGKGAQSAERELGWALPLRFARVAICNEAGTANSSSMPASLDGENFKKLVSGGDPLKGREAYGRSKEFINKSMLFLLANSFPSFSPADDAVLNRIIHVPFHYSYVTCPAAPHERLADPDIKTKATTPAMAAAFWAIIVREFNSWRDDGFAPYPVPEACQKSKDEVIPSDVSRLKDLLDGAYVITGDPTHFVITKELKDHCVPLRLSDTKLGLLLTTLGTATGRKKDGGVTKAVRTGIRKASDDELPIDMEISSVVPAVAPVIRPPVAFQASGPLAALRAAPVAMPAAAAATPATSLPVPVPAAAAAAPVAPTSLPVPVPAAAAAPLARTIAAVAYSEPAQPSILAKFVKPDTKRHVMLGQASLLWPKASEAAIRAALAALGGTWTTCGGVEVFSGLRINADGRRAITKQLLCQHISFSHNGADTVTAEDATQRLRQQHAALVGPFEDLASIVKHALKYDEAFERHRCGADFKYVKWT